MAVCERKKEGCRMATLATKSVKEQDCELASLG